MDEWVDCEFLLKRRFASTKKSKLPLASKRKPVFAGQTGTSRSNAVSFFCVFVFSAPYFKRRKGTKKNNKSKRGKGLAMWDFVVV
jgi:hypothetical protein